MKGDLITGIIATIFSIFYLSQTYSIKIFGGADAIADARTIPKIWGIGLLVLSIMLIIRSLYKMYKNKKEISINDKRKVIDKRKNKRESYSCQPCHLYGKPVPYNRQSCATILAQLIY